MIRTSRPSQFTWPRWKVLLLLGVVFPAFIEPGFALVEPQYVVNTPAPGAFCIAQKGFTAPIYVDTNDCEGVLIAAANLCADVNRVTGDTPDVAHTEAKLGTNAIIVGTLGKSRVVDELIRAGKIDVASITNKWESYFTQVVPAPMPGLTNSLVIVGSDKRGTIYGIYDLSAEMGVSPWYWWADVPVQHQENIFVRPGKYEQGPPAVKYRGIFLNDEWPDLTEWVQAKYGLVPVSQDPPIPPGVANYGHEFYERIFELLLRLKANYLWPAMWNNAFNEDDPLNPKLANEYGIVMGTSHQEPMLRAQKEWDRRYLKTVGPWSFAKNPDLLEHFWRHGIRRNKNYESIITIGLRGPNDTPMAPGGPEANMALLGKIVKVQRQIIAQDMNPDPAKVPQLWCPYKEVLGYYDAGFRVPDDVTILWTDDNWGDIRRLPAAGDQKRSGAAGIYYHFDYVGGPRNYKWLNTNPTTKIWEQMNLAYHYHARRIWMVNVGHLKGYELPLEFFMNLAWNPDEWPKERIAQFTRRWAQRQFGPQYASQIADILARYTKYNGRRKPELLEPDTFSLVNYQEADKVLADWKAITAEAEDIYRKLPPAERDAFFELVLYPTKACQQVNDLYISTAKNRLYAAQGRASANDYAARARKLFQADADLSAYYNHTLANGRWDHMMDQTHIGYTHWQQPPRNVMPHVEEITVPTNAALGVAIEGSTNVWPAKAGQASRLPSERDSASGKNEHSDSASPLPTRAGETPGLLFDVFNRPREYIDVFNRGQTPFQFTATTSAPWIELSENCGTIEKEKRLWVTVAWAKAPKGSAHGSVKITGAGKTISAGVDEFNPQVPSREALHGFVEADGYVSMEAIHYTRKIDAGPVRWEEIPNLGRTLSAMSIFPVTAQSVTPPGLPRPSGTTAGDSPCLEYRMYLFQPGQIDVEAIIDPTLNFIQGRGLRYALSFDDQAPEIVTAVPADYNAMDGNHDWETTVKDSVRKVHTSLTLSKTGYHTLKFWMVDPGVVLQKLVVNLGGVKPSYLGPPESYRHDVQSHQ